MTYNTYTALDACSLGESDARNGRPCDPMAACVPDDYWPDYEDAWHAEKGDDEQ